MQHQNQSSIQQRDDSFGQYSSLNAASSLNTTVTAAHCPEVLWYDEVGAVSSRDTHKCRHNTSYILIRTASQVAGAWRLVRWTRGLLVWRDQRGEWPPLNTDPCLNNDQQSALQQQKTVGVMGSTQWTEWESNDGEIFPHLRKDHRNSCMNKHGPVVI